MSTQTGTKERTKTRVEEPKQFNVLMYNDDFTTMDFVVRILIDIFHKDDVSAQAIMLGVHQNGKAVVGKYPYDIAISRVDKALSRAKAAGFPFRMSVEEA
ncbi:MAG: ATP-dependent Clp protease adaptor ClpS [Phascolarctobacterium sp.]|nr:ATP-dependent Clp protease adaptor ClpS [Phascolarctobacterium sp.]